MKTILASIFIFVSASVNAQEPYYTNLINAIYKEISQDQFSCCDTLPFSQRVTIKISESYLVKDSTTINLHEIYSIMLDEESSYIYAAEVRKKLHSSRKFRKAQHTRSCYEIIPEVENISSYTENYLKVSAKFTVNLYFQ
jgi:hypothetical protein